MKKFSTILIVIVLLILAVIYLPSSSQAPEVDLEKNDKIIEEDSEPKETISILDKIMESYSIESLTLGEGIAELVAVDDSSSSGMAYELVEDGTLYHAVVADMPSPAEGNSYEGWLVQTSPLEFISTGIMEEVEEGVWTLEFTTNEEISTYNKVIITEEEEIDATPEKHIIEGDFN